MTHTKVKTTAAIHLMLIIAELTVEAHLTPFMCLTLLLCIMELTMD